MAAADFTYDKEWVNSLVGLPMAVPEYWWPRYKSTKLFYGKVTSIEPNAPEHNFFVLELHDEPGKSYGMQYDAVLLYADENNPAYSRYRLPPKPPIDPTHEKSVTVRRGRREVPAPKQIFSPSRSPRSKRRNNGGESELDSDDSSDDKSDHEHDEGDWLVEYTDPDDWILVTEKQMSSKKKLPEIKRIPYRPREGESIYFDVRITDDELESVKDDHGDIRFEKVVELLLPGFDGEGYFEWIGARMQNYMIHIIRTQDYKPRYYNPASDKVIMGNHVARFFGVQITRMLRGFPSIEETWSTRESLFEVDVPTESMPRNAFQDLNRCLHFVDDWEDEDGVDWEDVYLDERYKTPKTAKDRTKFGFVEDSHNDSWKEHILFGEDATYDESRCAGWYPGGLTKGPEPKPIRTGATLHSMCVTKGPLSTYLLHVRVYGGKNDEDLNKVTGTVGTVQKFINLLEMFLGPFMGRGCIVTMDSAYMGELLAQVATKAWKVNVISTAQVNRCGPDPNLVKAERSKMKPGTYECKFFVHKTSPLCVAPWADNNIVTTLSNHHSPEILKEGEGVFRRKKNKDGGRDMVATAVKIPLQTSAYTHKFFKFFKIDKRNQKDAQFDLKGVSKKHNWSPKLILRLFNMNSGNSGTYYERLCSLYTPDRRILLPKERMADLAHRLCQRGPPMRSLSFSHPPWVRDISRVFNNGVGRKVRSDAHGIVVAAGSSASKVIAALSSLKALRFTQQKRSPWRHHQNLACERRGRCAYSRCPGIVGSKLKNGYDINMRCEECSALLNKDVFLCNGTKGLVEGEKRTWKVCLCHVEYHKLMFNISDAEYPKLMSGNK